MMMLSQFSALASLFKLLLLLVVFVLVLVASYYVTRWYAKSGFVTRGTSNISVIEAYQMSPGKFIYIVKVGEKYIAVGGTKEQLVLLTELNEEELVLRKTEPSQAAPFADVFSQLRKRKKNL